MTHRAEPTLDDLLADPLTLSLMAADRVDPARLRVELRSAAIRIGRPDAAKPLEDAVAKLLRNCIEIAGALGPRDLIGEPAEPRRPW